MKPSILLRWLGKDSPQRTHAAADHEATIQLDRLLQEVHTNERLLPADHFTKMADAFDEHVAVQTAVQRIRLHRPRFRAPLGASWVPLGGLAALVGGLVFWTGGPGGGDANVAVGAHESVQRTSLVPGVGEPLTPELTELTRRPTDDVSHADESARHIDLATVPNARGGERSNPLRSVASKKMKTPQAESVSERPSAPPLSTKGAAEEPANRKLAGRDPSTPRDASGIGSNSREADTFSRQLRALKEADKALKAGKTEQARRALSFQFSQQLSPHANALRAVMACQEREFATGRRLLATQARRYPHSPYLERIRRACGVEPAPAD